MYGTIARVQIQPGMKERLLQLGAEEDQQNIPGAVFDFVYQMDDDPNVFYLVVGFESKEAYFANADSPGQNERYLRMRKLLAVDPEWHDGEIVYAHPGRS